MYMEYNRLMKSNQSLDLSRMFLSVSVLLMALRIIQINDVYDLANFSRLKTLIDRYSTENTVVICAWLEKPTA